MNNSAVYILQHLHINSSGEEDVKFIGAYSSASRAADAARRIGLQPGFKECSKIVDTANGEDGSGFYIDKYEIDKDHWCEGYFTYET